MNPPKILIADDDHRLARALSERLRSVGYDVVIANDAYHATSDAHREKPDLLILDIHMPAGKGFCVQERVGRSATLSDVPVIYVTGDTSDEALAHAERLGAVAMFYKPVKVDRLLEAIERTLQPKAA